MKGPDFMYKKCLGEGGLLLEVTFVASDRKRDKIADWCVYPPAILFVKVVLFLEVYRKFHCTVGLTFQAVVCMECGCGHVLLWSAHAGSCSPVYCGMFCSVDGTKKKTTKKKKAKKPVDAKDFVIDENVNIFD